MFGGDGGDDREGGSRGGESFPERRGNIRGVCLPLLFFFPLSLTQFFFADPQKGI